MSSGEQAKPPATVEERNPFDISRRSGPEVAAEIAKRMAAWKQARTRTAAPSTTIPSGDAKQPPIAAPVQPARMPKPATPAPQPEPVARSAKNAGPRVPYFASAAARRAMPPAPSLKQASTPPQPEGEEIDKRVDEPATAAPMPQQESPPHYDEAPAVADAVTAANPETPLADTTPAAIEDAPTEAPLATEIFEPIESPPVTETPESIAAEPDDDTERRRAEARAIKARWIAARDLDALIDTSAARGDGGSLPAVEAHEEAQGADKVEDAPALAVQTDLTVAEIDDPVARGLEDEAPAATAAAAMTVEELAPETPPTTRVSSTDLPNEAWRLEPTFDAPTVRAPIGGRDVAGEAQASGLTALDEVAGRKEPTFDAPVAPETRDVERESDIAPRDDAADVGLSVAALDDVAGRKEPTFDTSVQPEAHAAEVATRVAAAAGPQAEEPADIRTAAEAPELSITALDEAAGRKEPTFDAPAPPAKPAAPVAAPRIALRPIETRIEARRVDTLRAEPQPSIRRPIFARIEPEEWDVPPAVAARANRARGGTGWAIGLGSVLLIAGITAPAAIWQQGRQAQDQVALVNPAPPQQQAPAATAETPQIPAHATLPEAPQPATAPPFAAPEPNAPAVVGTEELKASAPQPEAEQAAINPQPATTLGPVGDGGNVMEAPVMAPPPPSVSLASQAGAAGASPAMVARPFVPEQGDGPFLRAPTTGTTTVPVASAPTQSASVGVKPNLMVVLKPKAAAPVAATKPAASKPKPLVVRKPKPFFQQSPEQMFQTLVDTLSEGRPVNPATKPVPPSTRR
jgi:hypothetical protein